MASEQETEQRPWEKLQELLLDPELTRPDTAAIEAFLDTLSWSERARAISRLSHEEQERLFTTLSPEDAADIVETLPDAQATDVIELLSPQEAALIVEELPSDQQADLLGNLHVDDAEAILSEMDPQEALEARALQTYAADQAGGLMITEFLSFDENKTVAEVLHDLRINAGAYRDYDIYYLYVTSHGSPVGVLQSRELLLGQNDTKISQIMHTNLTVAKSADSIEALATLFETIPYLALPVVDERGMCIGIVKRSAVEEAKSAQSASDFRFSQGIVGGDELRSQPLTERTGRRLSWLSLNIVLNICSASVIAAYQDTLAQVIALAVFLPIISDMSGCSGAQAMAVSIRELSLGLVKPQEVVRVFLKEIQVGLINGLLLGIMVGLVAFLWEGNAWLGAIVGGALAVNTIISVVVGGNLPLLIKRFGFDPALASGVMLTTITDICGFFLVMNFAKMLLPLVLAG